MGIQNLIDKFRKKYIDLTREQLNEIREKRDRNLERLKAGLKEKGYPSIAGTINQGGYAMKTMTQQPQNDTDTRWDIDLGVVFAEGDAQGAKTMRTKVHTALVCKTAAFSNEPELKNKCVRITYSDGYQVDFPVFQLKQQAGRLQYEVSIGDAWIKSDPEAINSWFEERLKALSPADDASQLRYLVRIVKYYCKVRGLVSGKMPGGLLATALTVNNYVPVAGRIDESFRLTLDGIAKSLKVSTSVHANGVQVSDDKDTARLKRLANDCENAVKWLSDISDETEPTKIRSAWKKVFKHSFFESDEAKKALNEDSQASDPATAVSAPETKSIAVGTAPWTEY